MLWMRKLTPLVLVGLLTLVATVHPVPAAAADGDLTWSPQLSGAERESPLGVGYGGNLFVAVGYGGWIMTSPDGTTWTARSSNSKDNLEAVAYGNGKYVIVSQYLNVVTSTDGVTWTTKASPATGQMKSIVFAGGKFVAVSPNAGIMTSPDGETWTLTPPPQPTTTYSNVIYARNQLLLWANNAADLMNPTATLQSSQDGTNWTKVGQLKGQVSAMACSDTLCVALATTDMMAMEPSVFTSTDLQTWTAQPQAPLLGIQRIGYGNGYFVAVGSGTFWSTQDGTKWTEAIPRGVKNFYGVAAGGGRLVVVGSEGTIYATPVLKSAVVADAGKSTLRASPLLTPGDGKTATTVTVTLLAADGTTPVSGKTVTLAQGSGSHAVIGAASGPSDAKGQVTFTVTDATPEDVTFTATDSTDNVAITQTATVTFLAHPAYVKGYPDGTFKPDDPVTRAQLAKVLAVALGLDTANAPAAGFPDVATDFWAYGYINAVRAKGLIKGFPDGTFNPGGQVTHGQLAAIVARQLGLQPVAGAGSHWAAGYIAAIRQAGFLKDFEDQTYDPDAPATRAEVVVLVEEMTGRQKASGAVTAQFTDVPATYWAAAYIQDATHEGWAP